MLKKHRIISVIVCISMLYCLIVSSNALGTPQIFSGKIISEDNIDLSDVEIKIYSSEPQYDEEGNLLYYSETYVRSVYADSNGDFEFIKPSAYCSYTINIETLPANYGVTKHTQFIVPTRTSDNIYILRIATANTELNGDSIYVTFESSEGTALYTYYEIVPDKKAVHFEEKSESITTSKKIISYEDLKNTNTYTYSGTIITNGKNYRYLEDYDISGFSEIQKADFLYYMGEISEKTKNDIYSLSSNTNTSQSCVHIIPENILSTNDKNRSTSSYQQPSYDKVYSIPFGSYSIEVRYTEGDFINHQTQLKEHLFMPYIYTKIWEVGTLLKLFFLITM